MTFQYCWYIQENLESGSARTQVGTVLDFDHGPKSIWFSSSSSLFEMPVIILKYESNWTRKGISICLLQVTISNINSSKLCIALRPIFFLTLVLINIMATIDSIIPFFSSLSQLPAIEFMR